MDEQAGKRVKTGDVSQSTKAVGCRNTLAEYNEAVKLELPRAWELLDSSKPSRYCEGSSSHCMFPNGNKT